MKPGHRDQTPRAYSAAACVIWLGLIFGTSCTVILPSDFFSIVQEVTGATTESMERFTAFWGVSWFIVVKGWHFAEFAILTFLVAAALSAWRGSLSRGTIAGAVIFAVLFAASDEWHQSFVPDRVGSVQDVLIDCAGVFVAGLFLMIKHKRKAAQNQARQATAAPRLDFKHDR